ncbi:glyoxylate reductase/hydroxypyruvate reductase-like [Hyalella azteca]|uniref:Glyoxylate reductase/hydroxypyruvate reductase n=1 Tax=Hyalella azteca TaxID=294128 RepID=A0A8B7N446_HYAAZ|nr:glyoxylate reductase/hydroxypyruvate reductase-like [Hyalella azteca]
MEKPKVLITKKDVPQIAIRKLRELCDVDIYEGSYPMPRDQLLARVAGKDGLFCFITDRINTKVLDAAGRSLRVISTMSVGYDHLSLEEMKSRDIKVGYTPDVLTDATAELTLALLLATWRRLLQANAAATGQRCCYRPTLLLQANAELNNGGWGRCVWGPVWMLGKGLSGSTVGIFGLGRTGQAVLKRLAGFNVAKFLYTSTTKKELGGSYPVAEFVSFERLLQESDFVICTAALNEQTRAKFNKDAFAAMKNSAVFINTSRGGLVDQEALVWAIQTGQIRAAGLDVMTPEPLPADHILTTLPNCTLLPHLGTSEERTRAAMAELAADNLLGGLIVGKQMPKRLC